MIGKDTRKGYPYNIFVGAPLAGAHCCEGTMEAIYMHVVLLMMRLRLTSRNLKEKRSIIKSVLARARNRFNVACRESGLHDRAGDSELAFVTVAESAAMGRSLLQELERWLVEERPDLEVTGVQVEEL